MAERESLIRLCGQPEWELRSEADDQPVMEGYAAVWNSWTEIHSWEGDFREQFHPKAFNRALKEDADRIQVLFDHGMDPQIGQKPLGRIRELRADDHGLWVEVPLDPTSYNQDIKALLKSGALRGMSFRFSAQDDEWEYPKDDLPKRTVRAANLLELGPVTFPAYKATQAGVRAHAPEAFMAWRSASNVESDSGQAETTPEDEGQAETTPEPEPTPDQPAEETETRTPTRSISPNVRALELERMRTVAASRALRLARSPE